MFEPIMHIMSSMTSVGMCEALLSIEEQTEMVMKGRK